jgi:uncharacterized protein with GYD domain
MAKYLVQFSYTDEGVKGLIKDGGTKRREVVEQLIKGLGGKVEAYYFAFGEWDGIVIVDGSEEDTVGALLAIGASGAVKLKTTVLITPEEMDKSVKKVPSYRPPGK